METFTTWAFDSLNDQATEELVPTMGQNTGMATGRAGVIVQMPASDPPTYQESMFSPEDSPARTTALQDNAEGWLATVARSGGSITGSSLSSAPPGLLERMCPGSSPSRDGADFETIVGSLTECGYGVAWAVLDAQYFGVAQRRRRVFIVGHIGGVPRPEVLALSEGVFGHPEPRRDRGEGSTAGVRAFAQNTRDEVRELEVAGALAAQPGMKQTSYLAFNWQASRPDWVTPHVGHIDALQVRQIPAVASASSDLRRLTPLECERLQGFPDGWTDIPGNSDTQRYRQLGNAVAVPVVEWLLGRIAA